MSPQDGLMRERQDFAALRNPHTPLSARPLPPREPVDADAAPRRLALHATMTQLFLRFDPTHELPHVVQTKTGHIVARFEKDADLAWFISRGKTERPTLPEAYVLHLTGGQ